MYTHSVGHAVAKGVELVAHAAAAVSPVAMAAEGACWDEGVVQTFHVPRQVVVVVLEGIPLWAVPSVAMAVASLEREELHVRAYQVSTIHSTGCS